MIRELSDLGKRLREEKSDKTWTHDALKEETISLVLTIKQNGEYVSLQRIKNKKTIAEAIQRTSGKSARILIDNCGYALGVYDPDNNNFKKKAKQKGIDVAHRIFQEEVSEKFDCFLSRIKEFEDLPELKPVIDFYKGNSKKGIQRIPQREFLEKISPKDRSGNIAFLILGENNFLHECRSVYKRIIAQYEKKMASSISKDNRSCSICGNRNFPIGDILHFPIKGVPGDKEPAGGRKLVSYNGDNNPFESYEMIGNENCMICTNCAKTYVEGLNWLLSAGSIITNKKGKDDILFTNRWPRLRSTSFFVDTAMVYWTRENQKLDELDLLEAPDAGQVAALIDSVVSGSTTAVHAIQDDMFYSCTLSGAAARIVIRDWIELSLSEYRKNIGLWFNDIAIESFGQTYYAPLYWLAKAGHNEKSDSDTTLSRTAAYLWNAALKKSIPPLWILGAVLKRLRYVESSEDGKEKNDPLTRERVALIRLILNRNNKEGGYLMNEQLDKENLSPAYVCGQIFAVLVDIQRAALGKDINAGIRERFFSFASTTPAPAFGRLMKLSQTHLTKLKGEKPGLSVILDHELQFECAKITEHKYPAILSLEEQGQFALGYYHKKQETWKKAQANKELKEALENEEEEK